MSSFEEYSKCFDIVKNLMDEYVSSISNCQYYFNDEFDDEDFGDIEILTASGLKICFGLSGDGESVIAYRDHLRVPSPFELECGGRAFWVQKEINESKQITGASVVDVDALFDYYDELKSKVLAGWRVKLSNGDYFVFYNCGDNSRFLFNEMPCAFLEGIETVCESVLNITNW